MAYPIAGDVRTLRIAAVMNTDSGSCNADSEAKLKTILHAAQVSPVEVACVDGAEVDPTIDRLVGAEIDVLIVLGGDGTIRTAAEKCGKARISLIALPGGTMNMLSKALYGDCDWETALTDTLRRPRIYPVGGGVVEGHQFFCAGIFGSPSLWADAREALREGRVLKASRRALAACRRMFVGKVVYRFGAQASGTAAAVAVICPLISAALSSATPSLEAVALNPAGAAEAFRLALHALFRKWRSDPSVSTVSTPRIEILFQRPIPALLDGETVRLSRKIEITYVTNCFNALITSGTDNSDLSALSHKTRGRQT